MQTGEAEDGTHRYGVAIYNGDFLCGFFGVRDFPKDGMKQTNDWELFCAGLEPAKSEEYKDIFIPENAERLSIV